MFENSIENSIVPETLFQNFNTSRIREVWVLVDEVGIETWTGLEILSISKWDTPGTLVSWEALSYVPS